MKMSGVVLSSDQSKRVLLGGKHVNEPDDVSDANLAGQQACNVHTEE